MMKCLALLIGSASENRRIENGLTVKEWLESQLGGRS